MSNETAATKEATTDASQDAKAIKEKAKTDTKGAAELLRKEVEDADKHEGWDPEAKKAYKAELTKRLFDDNKNYEDKRILGGLVIEYVNASKADIGISESGKATLDTIKNKAGEAATTDPLKARMLSSFALQYAELKNEVRDDGKNEGKDDTVDGVSNRDLESRVQKDRKREEDQRAMLDAAKEAGVEPYAHLTNGKVLFDVAREKLEKMNSLKPENERTKITTSQVFAECANIMQRSNDGRFTDVKPEDMAKNGQPAVPKDWNGLSSRTELQVYSKEELDAIKAAKSGQKPPTEPAPLQPKEYPNGTVVKVEGNKTTITTKGADPNNAADDVVYTKEGDGKWKKNGNETDKAVRVDKDGAVTEVDPQPKDKTYPNGTTYKVEGNKTTITTKGADPNNAADDAVYTKEGDGKWKKNGNEIEQDVQVDNNGLVTEVPKAPAKPIIPAATTASNGVELTASEIRPKGSVYNPLRPPGFEGETGESWSSERYAGDEAQYDMESRTVISDTKDPTSGARTVKYSGIVDNGDGAPMTPESAFNGGDTSFTASEVIKDNKIQERHVLYQQLGVEMDLPDGTGNNMHVWVRSIDSKLDPSSGTYTTKIVDNEGKEYWMQTDTTGKVVKKLPEPTNDEPVDVSKAADSYGNTNIQPKGAVYSALRPPGFEGETGETWTSERNANDDENQYDIESRSLVSDSVNAKNGVRTVKYSGIVDNGDGAPMTPDSWFNGGDTSFTASENLKDGKIVERHVMYQQNGVSMTLPDGKGGTVTTWVRQIDSKLDPATGRYNTKIVDVNGQEYTMQYDSQGKIIDTEAPKPQPQPQPTHELVK